MLKNKDYDLVETIATKSKGLARYDLYLKDASACPDCQNVWQQLKAQDERQVGMLVDELKRHVEHQDI
jgi:hypothetical protein